MITQNGTKTTLKSLIETEAKSLPYKYDDHKSIIYGRGETLMATKEEFEIRNRHHGICMNLVALSHEFNNYPYTSLVYIAIGGSAHKQSVFHQGYTKIDIKKARKVLKWLTKLAKYCKDDRYMRYDIIVHAISKFHDKVTKDDKVFQMLLNSFNCSGRKPSSWKTMEEFYAEFTNPMFSAGIIIAG